jgi:hypothetical protein
MSIESVPLHPRLVLRIGFAGTKQLPPDSQAPAAALAEVFETAARRIAEIAPGVDVHAGEPEPWIQKFYSTEVPLLRLITGLCEGADSLAFQTLEGLKSHAELGTNVETELAAVVPFDLPVYRSSRPADFHAEFDRQAKRCAYILCLGGVYEKPDPDTPAAKESRARAYRGQSALLLRQSDMLVAVADASEAGRAGGTIETVREALRFDLPVVFIDARTARVRLLDPGANHAAEIARLGAASTTDWEQALRRRITAIAAGGAEPGRPEDNPHHSYGEQLLEEFFKKEGKPLRFSAGRGGKERLKSFREKCWDLLYDICKPPFSPKSDPALEPYAAWRRRATNLNYHYAGLYRGAFLLNYGLAALAVFLAALSLALLAIVPPAIDAAGEAALPGWLTAVLFVLGSIKFAIVVSIFVNTRNANKGDWNDKAVDYRYLSERLRAMFYLPRIGSFQPPAAAPSQYASRAVRQSAAQWLMDAIVRSSRPDFAPPAEAGGGEMKARIIRLDPSGLLSDVRNSWIGQQAVYHDKNARTMERLRALVENWGKTLNVVVIGFVLLDTLGILLADLPGLFPVSWTHLVHASTPWLLFSAAVLPAAVASLNGIRFQSECRRLAERSALMRTILGGRDRVPAVRVGKWRRFVAFMKTLFPRKNKAEEPAELSGGKWAEASGVDPSSTADVLYFTESVARLFAHEVAEWSVLYAKEVPEG